MFQPQHVVAAVEVDPEDPPIFDVPAAEVIDPPLRQIRNRCCCLKLWKIFFIMQAAFILFFLDIAFIPIKKYACNPFKGLAWNYENNTTYRDQTCRGQGCWEKQERCLENCAAYQHFLDEWKRDAKVARYYPEFYPNPLCFYWEEAHFTDVQERLYSPSRKFTQMKKRAETVDWQRQTATFWNVTSLLLLLVWFIIFCSQCTRDYKMTSILLFSASLGMFGCGNYLAHQAVDVLRCFTRVTQFDPDFDFIGRHGVGYDYLSFCDAHITYYTQDTTQKFYLPPLPKSWTISYYLLGIRSTLSLVFVFLWSCHVFIGPDFWHHRAVTFVELGMTKIWERVRRG